MVGLVILYDHVHPVGAFARGAHMDVKGCVRLLQAQPPVRAEPLLNALRYTTKHLNEENTPRNIKSLLAAWIPDTKTATYGNTIHIIYKRKPHIFANIKTPLL